jgi:hypothetical protein
MQIDFFKKWEQTGLLEDVVEEQDRLKLALAFEAMAAYILYGNDLIQLMEYRVDCVIFPIVKRMLGDNGYKMIDCKQLYSHVESEWEKFNIDHKGMNIDPEVEFVSQFCENNRDGFVK